MTGLDTIIILTWQLRYSIYIRKETNNYKARQKTKIYSKLQFDDQKI